MNIRPFLASVLLKPCWPPAASAPLPPTPARITSRGEQLGDGVRQEPCRTRWGQRTAAGHPARTATLFNQAAASAPPPTLSSSGQASFNFEGESLQAVVKAILGDMLGQNYNIAPGVSGHGDHRHQKPSARRAR